MHEICATILLAVDLDSTESQENKEVQTTLDRNSIEHDTWSIYEAVMRNAMTWYQWREEPALRGGEKVCVLSTFVSIIVISCVSPAFLVKASTADRSAMQPSSRNYSPHSRPSALGEVERARDRASAIWDSLGSIDVYQGVSCMPFVCLML